MMAENKVLEKLIDAFATIEKYDIRVARINMPYRAYDEIVKDQICRFDSSSLISTQQSIALDNTRTEARIGNLYGAEVFFSDKFEVFGEQNFAPARATDVIIEVIE